MRYFLIAGERSGDLHGSFLVRELKRKQPEAEISGYGGDLMEAAGMKLLSHYQEVSFMGFWEVLKNIKTISRKMKACKWAITSNQTDILVLIDFPGFNLRMAKYASERGIKVVYYIAPKVWAWKESRVKQLKRYVDRLYSILPFEKAFFAKHDFEVRYIGNPVVEELEQHVFEVLPFDQRMAVKIAYLPGSRVQEVRSSLPMIQACAELKPDYHFLVAGVENVPGHIYDSLRVLNNVNVVIGKTYEVLKYADAAIVTSGTATLETALLNVPQVVCYRTSKITYLIARAFIKVRFLSLVNLIQDEQIVQERVQQHYRPEIILEDVDILMSSSEQRTAMLGKYNELRQALGTGSASQNLVDDLIKWAGNSPD